VGPESAWERTIWAAGGNAAHHGGVAPGHHTPWPALRWSDCWALPRAPRRAGAPGFGGFLYLLGAPTLGAGSWKAHPGSVVKVRTCTQWWCRLWPAGSPFRISPPRDTTPPPRYWGSEPAAAQQHNCVWSTHCTCG
jgi:hypothetical protein